MAEVINNAPVFPLRTIYAIPA